jgi:hypothetical protein
MTSKRTTIFTFIAALVAVPGLTYIYSLPKTNDAQIAHDSQMRSEGWEAGALAVINYDMVAESLPTFKTWSEFETYAKGSKARRAALDQFFIEMDADRARRRALREAHPKLTAVP